MEQSKKTMRHFYCRDVLWETFEQMANDFDCSIDYLINEAMRSYAKTKNYASSGTSSQQVPEDAVAQAVGSRPTPAGAAGGAVRAQTLPPAITTQMAAVAAAPPTDPGETGPGASLPRPSSPTPSGRATSTQRPVTSAPTPRATPEELPPSGATLFLMFNNQRFPIEKDQFVIGRGSKTSDLPIKDGNISRKHAVVIRRNGSFYIKDLGSTNGIDYKGMRIDNKRIDEGDVFHLCDYELRFTYKT